MQELIIWASVGGAILLLVVAIACRIWKRNRYYKKVQHSLDEEERAFQETLARSYQDDSQLDGGDREKLRMLETYMASGGGGAGVPNDAGGADDAPMPTRVEDVDKFMRELAAAAAGEQPPPETEAPKPLTAATEDA